MMLYRRALVLVVAVGFIMACASPSWAWSRSKSGTYSGKHGTGSYQKSRTWDKDTRSGTYNYTKTTPGGKTMSKSGTVTKNADGSFTKAGTITHPNGNVTTVNKTLTKNTDGSHNMHATYTGQDGKTTTIDKTITKTVTPAPAPAGTTETAAQ